MKSKLVLLVCLLCVIAGMAYGQTAKGVEVAATPDTAKPGKTWAVIVGISKYKNVHGLNFADKDAQAFYNYLVVNEAGPKLPNSQIKLLVNESALSADIYGALDWLSGSVKQNDRVIFYFSGHGDLEKKTIKQNGFLLAYDSPSAAYMTSGTISINFLEDYLDTYVAQNKARDVLLIVDACRSGKLAGGEEGVRETMHALGITWNNQIIKILSAQEGELSYEDQKWGGGRGVFSYYLMKGIEGLANRNNDNIITTSELAEYLPFVVADATGSTQNPKIDGDPKDQLFTFNEKLLAQANQIDLKAGPMLAANGKGMADELAPDIQADYKKYLGYLEQGHVVWGTNYYDTLNCARHIYWQLINKPGSESIRASLKSSFIAGLQRKTQQILDDYVKEKISPIMIITKPTAKYHTSRTS